MPDIYNPLQTYQTEMLKGFGLEYRQPENVWRKLVGVCRVDDATGTYKIFDSEGSLRTQTDYIGSFGYANEITGEGYVTATYATREYALADWISKTALRKAGDQGFDLYVRAQNRIRKYLDNNMEQRVAAAVSTPGNYGANTQALAGAARWDVATGDPMKDLIAGFEACKQAPNVLLIPRVVWIAMRANPNVIKYVYPVSTQLPGAVKESDFILAVQDWVGVQNVVISRNQLQTSVPKADGTFTSAPTDVYGKIAALLSWSENTDVDEITTFKAFTDGESFPVDKEDPARGQEGAIYFKDGWNWDIKGVMPLSGYLLQTVIS